MIDDWLLGSISLTIYCMYLSSTECILALTYPSGRHVARLYHRHCYWLTICFGWASRCRTFGYTTHQVLYTNCHSAPEDSHLCAGAHDSSSGLNIGRANDD